MAKLIVAFRNFASAPKNPAAATTVHLRDYQAEGVRAIQKKTKYTFSGPYIAMCVWVIRKQQDPLFLPACFVTRYCCVGLVQLFFDVLVLVRLFCLLGFDKFHTVWTVHRDILLLNKEPTGCTFLTCIYCNSLLVMNN